MVKSKQYESVIKWRLANPNLHKERNKSYSNRRYHYFQQIKAFYNIDLEFFN